MSKGRSKSRENPNGSRRVSKGVELAPRSARKKEKKLLSDCTEADIMKALISR